MVLIGIKGGKKNRFRFHMWLQHPGFDVYLGNLWNNLGSEKSLQEKIKMCGNSLLS